MDLETLKDEAIVALVYAVGAVAGWGLAHSLQQESLIKKIIAIVIGVIVIVLAFLMPAENLLRKFLIALGLTFTLRVLIPKRGPFEPEAYQVPERTLDPKRFARPTEVARRLNVPINIVYDLIESGEIPAVKINAQWWVDWAELQKKKLESSQGSMDNA